jgi:septal ring factor EnvC (AmiA/AmiB activator)
MSFRLSLILLLLLSNLVIYGQTRADLEEKRKKTLEEIGYVDNLLKTTSREKSEGINDIKIIGKKLDLRESVIRSMKDELDLLGQRIDLNNLAVEMMEDDLVKLKSDYAHAVINSYISQKGNSELVFILSAKDFNQGYKRLKYLQQVTKFRRNEAEIILELKGQIESSRQRLENDLKKVSDLKEREEQQKKLLEGEQDKKQQIVKSLTNKEKQLQKELEEKKRVARKIENEIDRLIEEERKRAVKASATPEQKIIGDSFA